jgi:hypothetical protein
LKTRIIDIQNIINKEYELAISQLSAFKYAVMRMPSLGDMAKKINNKINNIIAPMRTKFSHFMEVFRYSKPR